MSSMEHVRMSSSSSSDESPKTKVDNSSSTSSKSNKGVSDVPSTKRFVGSGIDFKGKLIGVEEVAEARGDKLCQIAMAKLKAGVKASGEHKQRIIVHVSMEGIKIIDDKSAEVLHVHELNRISFISRDTGDSRAFGYIYRRNDGSHQFLGIKTEKAAETLILSLRDLFQAAFETKKKQEAETTSSSAGDDAVDSETGAKSESNEEQSRPTEKSEATSKEGDESTTAENLLNFEVEFQNLSRGTGTAPPVSPIWTIVDPWKPSSQTPQPPPVGVVGLPVVGVGCSPQLYQGSTLVVSPYGFANTAVRQAPPGMTPFSGNRWPAPPQQQQQQQQGPGVDPFVASSTGTTLATPLTAPSHQNSTVLGSTDAASPALGNPFVVTTNPASTASATNDPFAKLATGLLGATPASHQPGKRRADKSDFFPEPAKPSLLHLSQQQQQQQQQQQERGDDVRQVEQQTDVDLFGATPFSAALTTTAPVNDPFARIE